MKTTLESGSNQLSQTHNAAGAGRPQREQWRGRVRTGLALTALASQLAVAGVAEGASFVPTATDGCSGPPVVESLPAPGSLFPIGSTTVSCGAMDSAGNSVTAPFKVTVVGPREMLVCLIQQVNKEAAHPRPLLGTLDAALAAIDRNHPRTALQDLRVFQNKVRPQVGHLNAALAGKLIGDAQDIITALD